MHQPLSIQQFEINLSMLFTPGILLKLFYISSFKNENDMSSCENILPAFHQICNSSDFESLLSESIAGLDSVLEIYLKLIINYVDQCNDYSFLVRGPRYKFRAAISFVSIMRIFAKLYSRGKPRSDNLKKYWTSDLLQYAISKMFQWDTILTDVETPEEIISDPEFLNSRLRLSSEIFHSFRYILDSQLLYGGVMPPEIINWLITLEKRGLKVPVSIPAFLYDNLMSYLLAECYR